MRKWILLFFGLVVLISVFLYWKAKKNAVVPENFTGQGLPLDFADFYRDWHSDSLFQIKRTAFPLAGLPQGADSIVLSQDTFRWYPGTWVLQKHLPDQDSTFSVDRRVLNEDMIEEIIIEKTYGFGIIRRWAKMDGKWTLIYYAAPNRISRK
jgi:hypothetical protein